MSSFQNIRREIEALREPEQICMSCRLKCLLMVGGIDLMEAHYTILEWIAEGAINMVLENGEAYVDARNAMVGRLVGDAQDTFAAFADEMGLGR